MMLVLVKMKVSFLPDKNLNWAKKNHLGLHAVLK